MLIFNNGKEIQSQTPVLQNGPIMYYRTPVIPEIIMLIVSGFI